MNAPASTYPPDTPTGFSVRRIVPSCAAPIPSPPIKPSGRTLLLKGPKMFMPATIMKQNISKRTIAVLSLIPVAELTVMRLSVD